MGIWEAACGPQRRGVCAERDLLTTNLAAQISPAKINAALRQVAEASGYGAAKTLSAVYRNVFGLALTHEAPHAEPGQRGNDAIEGGRGCAGAARAGR